MFRFERGLLETMDVVAPRISRMMACLRVSPYQGIKSTCLQAEGISVTVQKSLKKHINLGQNSVNDTPVKVSQKILLSRARFPPFGKRV